jgi:hypothetical protein
MFPFPPLTLDAPTRAFLKRAVRQCQKLRLRDSLFLCGPVMPLSPTHLMTQMTSTSRYSHDSTSWRLSGPACNNTTKERKLWCTDCQHPLTRTGSAPEPAN